MDLKLIDQVMFVAGSSRGIGRAIATALLGEGARVVLTGRNQALLDTTYAELARCHEDRVLAIAGDLSNTEAIAAAFQQTVGKFGRIDHLIANLGTGIGKTGWELPEEEWTRLFEANFFASVRLTQAVLPYLLGNAHGGSILYISSIVALEATGAPLPYSAAKAALNIYSKDLARQLGARKVRVNTIAPGVIFFEGGSWEKNLKNNPAGVEQMIQCDVPQQRFGKPNEVASLACYVCSEHAAYVTGSCFVIDGGRTRSL